MEEKDFYIYLVNSKFAKRSISIRDNLIPRKICGCLVFPKFTKENNKIIILDTKIESELIFNPYVRPIPMKFLGVISSKWKIRSKNYKHILCLGFGKYLVIKHYSEGIIKGLRELKLI